MCVSINECHNVAFQNKFDEIFLKLRNNVDGTSYSFDSMTPMDMRSNSLIVVKGLHKNVSEVLNQ